MKMQWFRTSILFSVISIINLGFVLSSHAQTGGEPAWPQRFQVPQGESRGFGFAVTQPGPITVSVTSQGSPPIVLTLFGPMAQPIQQVGSGTLNISHNATAAEVQKSSLWVVTIGSNVLPPAIRTPPQIVAQGTIAVQHPVSDVRVAQPELQRRLSTPRPVATSAIALSGSTVSPKQAAYMNQIAAQQGAQKQALLRQITARPANVPRQAAPQRTAPSVRTGGSDGGQAGGSSGGVPQSPPPQISSISANQGQPGAPVLINGSGFGNAGEVHFIVNAGPPAKDVVATQVDPWSDTQILAYVPMISGIPAYRGQLYVKNANGQSQLVPFEFDPLLQYVSLDLKIEQALQDGGGFVHYIGPGKCYLLGSAGPPDPASCVDHSVSPNPTSAFGWTSNDDQFFPYLQLKGGWVTDSVELRTDSGPGGGAYLADKREGTVSPFAKVHWWVNPFGEMQYTLTITIRGPSGVPYM